ncbi:type II secretion system F family protein [Paracoccaceae bacterium]|nr:type II secretion system F family protein [Paracoccaceae bacterium]
MVDFLTSKKISKKYFWKYLNLLELLLSQNGRITDAVLILSNDGDKIIQKASMRVQENLKKGLSISKALAETFIIPNEKIISILRAGEESAALEKALSALIQDQKKTEDRNKRLIDLLIYPSIVFLFSILAIWIIFDYVIVGFSDIFENAKELPQTSKFLLEYSGYMGGALIKCLWLIVSILFLIVIIQNNNRFLNLYYYLSLKLPIIGSFVRNFSKRTFFKTLSLSQNVNIPLERCLELALESIQNIYFRKACGSSIMEIRNGVDLCDCLDPVGLVTGREYSQLSLAQKFGNLERIIGEIAIENDRATERRIETIMKLVGPFSILLLGGFILLIAMGVIVPLFSIQASIGGGL